MGRISWANGPFRNLNVDLKNGFKRLNHLLEECRNILWKHDDSNLKNLGGEAECVHCKLTLFDLMS